MDSPSYTLNHEEVEKAMQEGVAFAEYLTPEAVELDAHGHAMALALRRTDASAGADATAGQAAVTIPARTILVAAGTQPNTVLGREDPLHVKLDGNYFQAVDEHGFRVSPERGAKPETVQVITSRRTDGRTISFFGDLHPSFAGNVVKAMASATRGYPVIMRILERSPPNPMAGSRLAKLLDYDLRATIRAVRRLTPTIVEMIIHAPAAARAFRPGQFFRLQNYEALALDSQGTRLATEGLALTGAWVDAARGLVSTIVLEMGGSSNICALFRPGDPVVLMGPTGTATEIVPDEAYVLAGGGRTVFDRTGGESQGFEGALFCRVQKIAGSLQNRANRTCGRHRRLVQRRAARFLAGTAAGSGIRGKYRRRHRGLWAGIARLFRDQIERSRAIDCHRLRRDDGCDSACTVWIVAALSPPAASSDRFD
jgi:hypothetical protein